MFKFIRFIIKMIKNLIFDIVNFFKQYIILMLNTKMMKSLINSKTIKFLNNSKIFNFVKKCILKIVFKLVSIIKIFFSIPKYIKYVYTSLIAFYKEIKLRLH